ncbi:MAG TPA: malto-oligosyltrehalose synthase [Planctomycetota bacterium]|nr:malto-oligosyltrehalose synthase [Planctomycetota bacterium]
MRIPLSTYRLQLRPGFGFKQAAEVVPYLFALGVTDLYLSPIFKARRESQHGYDVTDPNELRPELGSAEDFDALVLELQGRGMGLLLDIVPNHMAVSHENPWWWDVLEKGESSRFAPVFDVDWRPPRRALAGKVLLPVLGDVYGKILEAGELKAGEGKLSYYGHSFPLRGGTPGLGGKKGEPRTWDALDSVLEEQCYRLAFWKTATPDINYRRFFDISDLVGVRQEDPNVFVLTHSLALRLVRSGKVTGLRVDHVDGLRDPRGYLERLSSEVKDAYVLVEKILTGDETLPGDWPVAGTTGYDWLKVANGIFADESGVRRLDRLHQSFTGSRVGFADIVFRAKRRVLEEFFPGELEHLLGRLAELAELDRHARDLGRPALREAIVTLTAALPVYRTYAREGELDEVGRRVIEQALGEARTRGGGPALDFLGRVVRLEAEGAMRFVGRWQQLTGPIMAKGLEDTALYVYVRLLSLNDIGARRSRARSLGDFHRFNLRRRAEHPHSMNATSTHDTKRSEDVRARLHVLSELAHEWGQALARWSRWNRPRKKLVGGALVPTPAEEMLLYQTLVGVFEEGEPIAERVKAYVLKAAREAKVHTSWTAPSAPHEAALLGFVDAILEPGKFLRELGRFAARVAFYGAFGSISQVVLKIGSPGVPDFYQGTELLDLSLVDPDNRRPVDFDTRRKMLGELTGPPASNDPGRVKLFVTSRALAFRKERRELFLEGEYLPLEVKGPLGSHVCSFARRRGEEWAIVAAPRLLAGLVPVGRFPVGRGVWGSGQITLPALAPRAWRNVFTGEGIRGRLSLERVFATFPVALLAA